MPEIKFLKGIFVQTICLDTDFFFIWGLEWVEISVKTVG